jgi:hypothetical protein
MPIANTDLVALTHVQELVQTHLAALKFFPKGSGGLAVARLLAALVDSVEQARRLCQAIVEECDEWPGPATLRRRYMELFDFDKLYPPVRKLTPPQIHCQACHDWGRVQAPDGKWVACACTPDFPPGLLELMNRPVAVTRRRNGRRILPANQEIKPVTQADIDRILTPRAAEPGQSPTPAALQTQHKEESP